MKSSIVSLVTNNHPQIFNNQNISIPKSNVCNVLEVLSHLHNSDLVVFPGWTLSSKSDLDYVIKNTGFTNTFVLEVGFGYNDRNITHSETGFYVVQNKEIIKEKVKQIFMDRKSANKDSIKLFLKTFKENRMFEVKGVNISLIICGENSILRNKQSNCNMALFAIDDDALRNDFDSILKHTHVFINPAHTPVGNGGKMRQRRNYLSGKSRKYLFTTNEFVKANGNPRSNKANLKSLQYISNNGEDINISNNILYNNQMYIIRSCDTATN